MWPQAFERSLKDLRTEYVDLLLLHYPSCWPGLPGCIDAVTPEMNWKESWRALVELYEQKKVIEQGMGQAGGCMHPRVPLAPLFMSLPDLMPPLLKVRSIGVSNFNLQQLDEVIWLPREKAVMPQVLQVRFVIGTSTAAFDFPMPFSTRPASSCYFPNQYLASS